MKTTETNKTNELEVLIKSTLDNLSLDEQLAIFNEYKCGQNACLWVGKMSNFAFDFGADSILSIIDRVHYNKFNTSDELYMTDEYDNITSFSVSKFLNEMFDNNLEITKYILEYRDHFDNERLSNVLELVNEIDDKSKKKRIQKELLIMNDLELIELHNEYISTRFRGDKINLFQPMITLNELTKTGYDFLTLFKRINLDKFDSQDDYFYWTGGNQINSCNTSNATQRIKEEYIVEISEYIVEINESFGNKRIESILESK